VVVLTSGSALAVNWANEHAGAILEAWYPGEEGGTAVADVLSGDYNPAGRLPITFYKSLAQLPPYTSYSMADRTYRYSTEQPLYPFGFGLSYSTFTYLDVGLADFTPNAPNESGVPAKPSPPAATSPALSQVSGYVPFSVFTRIKNSSSIPGNEVVQLYISYPGLEGAPIRALVGFLRVHLDAGASHFVSFTLTPRELSIVDPTGHRIVPAGAAELWIGSSQPISGPHLPPPNGRTLKFTITTSTPLPN
jgi:beta-glucosidase